MTPINNHVDVKEEEVEQAEFRSEEVQEILGTIPHWTIRSGSVYLFGLIIVAFFLAWLIRYPIQIKAPVLLTTRIPPSIIVSQNAGYLTLWVKDNQYVTTGQYIGYLNNAADVPSAISLMKTLDSFKIKFYQRPDFLDSFALDENLRLGELQDAYNSFMTSIKNYQFASKQKSFKKRAQYLNQEISRYTNLTDQQRQQIDIMAGELKLSRQIFERDSLLYTQNVISRAEFEQKKRDYLVNERAFKNSLTGITNTAIQKTQLTGRVQDLYLQETEQNEQHFISMESAMHELDGRLKKWEQLYLLKSPIAGKVSLFDYWSDNQFIKMSEEILTIVPDDKRIFARARVPVAGSGKITKGQQVKIKLDNYPYQEFGMISGTVQAISLLPRENNYSIIIELPQGLKTSHGKKMEFKQEMTGQAEIITEDLRLLDHIFYGLRKVFNGN